MSERSDIAILREMIRPSATVELIQLYQKRWQVVLEESDSDYAVTIHDMPTDENVIVIKGDAFHSPSKIFVGENNELKRADFIIVASAYNQKTII